MDVMTRVRPTSAMGHSTRRVLRELRDRILRGELAPGVALRQVDRIWALADAYIASGYASMSTRARTVAEHDQIIANLASRSRAELHESIRDHRDSTAAAVSAGAFT